MRTVQAIIVAGVLLSISRTSAQDAQNARPSLLEQVELLAKEGKLEEALRVVEQSLMGDRRNPKAWQYKGNILRHLKRLEEESACWNEYTELFPENLLGWRNLAGAQMRTGQIRDPAQHFTSALHNLNKAVELAQQEGQTYFTRGECYFLMGLYDEALTDFQSATRLGFADDAVTTYTTLLKRVQRQFKASEVPNSEWQPNYDDYLNVVKLSNFGGMLVSQMRDNAHGLPATKPGYAQPTLGLPGSCMKFDGTEDAPVQFAPAFEVWQGAWINDPTHGLLLDNGTKFRYNRFEDGKVTRNLGHVEDWVFIVDTSVAETPPVETQPKKGESGRPSPPAVVYYKAMQVQRLLCARSRVTVSADTLIGDPTSWVQPENHGYLRAKTSAHDLVVVFFRLTNKDKHVMREDLQCIVTDNRGRAFKPVATCVNVGRDVPVIVAGTLQSGGIKLISDEGQPLLGLVFVIPKDAEGLAISGSSGANQHEMRVDGEWKPQAQHVVKGTASGWWTAPPVGTTLEWVE